jgi:hypothetical protein
MDRDGKKIAYFIGDSIITVTLTTAPQYIGTLPSHPPLTKLTLTPKKFLLDTTQSMQMYATATDPANVPASIPHRLVQWKVIGTSGLIDTNGLFRALKPGNATITATYRGLSDSVTVTISAPSGSILIDDFNSPITFSLSTQNLDTTKTTFSISSEQSSNGTTSGKLYYEFTLKSGIPLLNYRAFLNADLMFIGKPDTLYVDVFGNGETHVVGFTFQDFSGRQSIKYAADQSVTWNGIWKTVKYALKGWIPVIEYPLTLKQLFLVIRTSKTVYDSTYKGTIYFDNLRTFYGTPTAIENLPLIPTHTMLMQNYPNPFNPKTAISYQLLANRHTLLKVLDVLGREVTTLVNEMKPPGKYIVTWDASKYPSGTYFYRLHTETNIETKRMVLVK